MFKTIKISIIFDVLSATAVALPSVICDARDLLSEFHSSLSDFKKNKPLVMLVDGVDLVRDSGGQLTSDWIPQQLPKVRKNTHTLIHS